MNYNEVYDYLYMCDGSSHMEAKRRLVEGTAVSVGLQEVAVVRITLSLFKPCISLKAKP